MSLIASQPETDECVGSVVEAEATCNRSFAVIPWVFATELIVDIIE